MKPIVPGPVRRFGTGLVVREIPRSGVSPEEMESARAYLGRLLAAETRDLERRLGRTFPEWTTLNASRRSGESAPLEPALASR
jgi:hypothetical protein